jgi:hypothetical protein
MKRREFLVAAATAVLPLSAAAQSAMDAMRFSALSAGAPLPEWLEPYTFSNRPRQTQFALVEDEGRTVLRARAVASTSGLIRRVRVDPRVHPILSWRWKVINLPAKGDLATKDGDDFSARIYLTFDLDPATLPLGDRLKLSLARTIWGHQLPAAALCYVWDGRAPVDTIAPNAYTDRVRMVVADSGGAELGRWVARERDIAADFRRAFGIEPPPIAGVIVSADTDNTGESVESYFGDIEFRARRTS